MYVCAYLGQHGEDHGAILMDRLDQAIRTQPWRRIEPRISGFEDVDSGAYYCVTDGQHAIDQEMAAGIETAHFVPVSQMPRDIPPFCAYGERCAHAIQTPHGLMPAMLWSQMSDDHPMFDLLTLLAPDLDAFYKRAYMLWHYSDAMAEAVNEVGSYDKEGNLEDCPLEEYVTGIPPLYLLGPPPGMGVPPPAPAEPEEPAGMQPYVSPTQRRLEKYKAKGYKLVENPSPEQYDSWVEQGVQNFVDYVLFPQMSDALCNVVDVEKCPCVRYMNYDAVMKYARRMIDDHIYSFVEPSMQPEEVKKLIVWGLCDLWQHRFGDAYLNDRTLREDQAPDLIRDLATDPDALATLSDLVYQVHKAKHAKPYAYPGDNARHFMDLLESKARAWQWTPPQSGAWVNPDTGEIYCRTDGDKAIEGLPREFGDKFVWTHDVEDTMPRFCTAGRYCSHRVETEGPDIGAPIATRLWDAGETLFARLCRPPRDAEDLMHRRYAAYQYRTIVHANFVEMLRRGDYDCCPLWLYVDRWYPARYDTGDPEQAFPHPPEVAPVPPPYLSPIQRQYEKLKAKGFKMFESAAEEREFHRKMMPNPAGHTEDCRPYRTAVRAIADQVMTDPSWRVGQTLDVLLEQITQVLERLGVGPGAQMELKQDALTCGFTVRPEHVEGETGGDEEGAAVLILAFDIAADVLWKSTGQDRIAFASAIRQAFTSSRVLHNPSLEPNPVADVEVEHARNAIYHCRGDADCALGELLAEGWDIETATFAVRAAAILVSDVAHRWDDTTEDDIQPDLGAAFVDNPRRKTPRSRAPGVSVYQALDPANAEVSVGLLADGSWMAWRMPADTAKQHAVRAPTAREAVDQLAAEHGGVTFRPWNYMDSDAIERGEGQGSASLFEQGMVWLPAGDGHYRLARRQQPNIGQYQIQTYALDYSQYMLEPHVVVRDLEDDTIETIWFPDRMSAERYFREDYETPAGQLQILSIPEALNAEIEIPEEYKKKRRGRRRNPAGGLHEGHAWSEFDPYWLAVGTRVEMEHTSDPYAAREISADHLVEDPMYYFKLFEAGLEDRAKLDDPIYLPEAAGF